MNLREQGRKYIEEMSNGLRLGVFGSRTLRGEEVRGIVEDEIEKYGAKTIVTAAEIDGVSKEARRIAHKKGLCQILLSPDHKRFGRGAYNARSLLVVYNSGKIVVIWDGVSRGTKGEIEFCKEKNIEYDLFMLKERLDLDFGVDD